jgi:hypothetical protein
LISFEERDIGLGVADQVLRRCWVLAIFHGGEEGYILTSLSDLRIAMVQELN